MSRAEQLLAQALQHVRAGRLQAAEACFRSMLEIAPDHAEGQHQYGLLLARCGHPEAAVDFLARAERLSGGRADIRINYATVCQHCGRLDEALRLLQATCDDGVRLPELFYNLGVVLQSLQRYSEAATAFAGAREINPDWPEAWMSEGSCRLNAGDAAAASGVLTEAHVRFPVHPALASNTLLTMNYLEAITPPDLLAAHRRWGDTAMRLAAASRPRPAPAPAGKSPGKKKAGGPIRLGFVSPNLADHSVAYFLEAWLMHLDRARVECIAYSAARPAADDPVTARLKPSFVRWRDTFTQGDDLLARRIADDRIDVLIDLAGHTAGNRLSLFAVRRAPLQVSMIGYPATTGLASVDYCLSDATLDPPEAARPEHSPDYVEAVHRLPLFCCYRPPESAPDVGELPLIERGAPTFGSFQTLGKLSDSTLRLWSTLLHEWPESRLSIKALGGGDPVAAARLRARLAALGVASGRIDIGGFAGFADYLEAHRSIDLCLDTLPWNGHTTTCHALWMGVPTLTLSGDRRAGRMGKALLDAVGLPGFAVDDPADYLATARRWVADVPALAGVRRQLRARLVNSPLCDGQSFARHFITFVEGALAAPERNRQR